MRPEAIGRGLKMLMERNSGVEVAGRINVFLGVFLSMRISGGKEE